MYLIQMSGVPGSGKSTLAEAISQRLDVVIVDHDTTKTVLLEEMDEELSNKTIGKLSYQLDWQYLESLLEQNKNVIFDSPCLYDEIISKGIELSEKYGYKYKFIECINKDFGEVEERLYLRNSKPSQIKKYKSYEVFYKALIGSKRPSGNSFILVDSSQKIETYLSKVINYIQEEQ